MNHGRIEQIGTPDELYFQPRTIFAADFLGESNILPIEQVERDGTELALRLAGAPYVLKAPARDEIAAPRHIMIRPESLRLVREAQAGWNAVEVTLTDVIFTGGVTRYIAKLSTGQAVTAAELTAPGSRPFNVGDTATLQWRPEQTIVLPEPNA
jgi:putative spermidine/putrescine transport system ATP-binding protein